MNDYRKKIITTVIMIFGLILVITGVTFALLNVNYTAKNVQVISSVGYSITYTESDDPINAKLKPMSDSEGLVSGNDFTFNVKATSNDNLLLTYNVFITLNSSSKMPLSSVKYNLEDITNNKTIGPNLMSTLKVRPNTENNESYYLYTNKFNLLKNVEQIHNYKLTVWATEDVSDVGIKKETTDTKQTTIFGGSDFLLSFRVSVEVKETKDVEQLVLLKDKLLGDNNENVVTAGDGLYKEEYTPSSELSSIYQNNLNSGNLTTYYYKGQNVNNYVNFAGLIWRVIRINEDGSIRLILNDGINDNAKYEFNPNGKSLSNPDGYPFMYYSNSDVTAVIDNETTDGIKKVVDSWYNSNLSSYTNYIEDSTFCEEARTKRLPSMTSGSAETVLFSSYTPSFDCKTDGNGKGILNLNIGLITVDEYLKSGGIFLVLEGTLNSYLTPSSLYYWTMSPAGVYATKFDEELSIGPGGTFDSARSAASSFPYDTPTLRPVISLKADTMINDKNDGTSTNPYQIN